MSPAPDLGYRMRTAEPADEPALRAAIGSALAHPDGIGSRGSYRGAASRGDILLLEHFDRQQREWQVAGFVDYHQRVDDSVTIRDIGNSGDRPLPGVVHQLLDEVFRSLKPTSAQVKIRRDASLWIELFSAFPGFSREGEEYRRPHYWTIWRWEPTHGSAQRQSGPLNAQPGRLTPPRPIPPPPLRREDRFPPARRPFPTAR